MDIKNIMIFLIVFFIILWLQHNDDYKFNKIDKRISLYDKIKIPLVSALLVILIKEFDLNTCTNFIQSIMIIKPPNIKDNFLENINLPQKVLNDIYIGPPDF
jgi:hypothetical protein